VLPLYALPFGLWFIMMTPSFVPGDDKIQEVVTFATVPLLKAGADVRTVALVLLRQMCGHPPCRNFVEPKIVLY
jgi:hypothetical protein